MIEFIPGSSTSAAALNAERVRLEIIAQNIANANTTRGPNGLPYQRQEVVFETVLGQQQSGSGVNAQPLAVRIARIQADPQPPRLVYNPGHPDANAQGMVALPNINIHAEMADLIASSRTYEANLAAIKTARTMADQTLSIGKHV